MKANEKWFDTKSEEIDVWMNKETTKTYTLIRKKFVEIRLQGDQ